MTNRISAVCCEAPLTAVGRMKKVMGPEEIGVFAPEHQFTDKRASQPS